MTSYLIYPTEQEALDRSHDAHVHDTVAKMREVSGMNERSARNNMVGLVTEYRWAIDVGLDGQTALVIDGDEQLLTPEEQALLISDLPDDAEGDNWYKPPPEMPTSELAETA